MLYPIKNIGVLVTAFTTLGVVSPLFAEEIANVPSKDAGYSTYDPRSASEMDLLATPEQTAQFLVEHPGKALVFCEDRLQSVRWQKALPQRWLKSPQNHLKGFSGKAQPGEYYVFQLGVFAASADLKDLQLAFSPLASGAGAIPATAIQSLSTQGIDYLGKPFTKNLSVAKGTVKPLWVGVTVPKTAQGSYKGTVTVKATDGLTIPVPVEITVDGAVLNDYGDRDSWRLSRLRWLNSQIGFDDNTVTQKYTPVQRVEKTLNILGRSVQLSDSGLPEQFHSFFTPSNTSIASTPTLQMLSAPFRFVIETDAGVIKLNPAKLEFVREQKGAVAWRAMSQNDSLSLTVDGLIEYDGYVQFDCRVNSSKPVSVKDIRLEFAVAKEASSYFMGLNQTSGKRPTTADWKWDITKHQDGFWMGAVNGGFKFQMVGDNYRSPLINCYYQWLPLNLPESWAGADGKSGAVRMNTDDTGNVRISAVSGPRTLQVNSPVNYGFKIFLTPFHTLNTEEQWSLRYYHKLQGVDDQDYRDLSRVKAAGASVINIHHNKEQNPVINYPYYDESLPLLKQCVADAHANDIKTKIYYTTRELTNNLPELFAFWNLDGEIICASPGKDGVKAKPLTNQSGPNPWLVEHLGETGYIPAWRETLKGRYKGLIDLAVITTPSSRLDNFYLEGLNFTLKETNFDGLYIDDTALGRKSFQRAHRIFEANGKSLLIDMHSWNHAVTYTAGSSPSSYIFMQNYPYYHRIWHGEGFNCQTASFDNWLLEMSGIPYGLMGEMLDHQSVWKGMIFGQTGRLKWAGDPRPMWKFWDQFGMSGTTMIGAWDASCPVKTNHPDIKATVYKKAGKSLISIASWAKDPVNIQLAIDWDALGLNAAKASFWAPKIDGFQNEAVFEPNAPLNVPAGKGWLMIVDETPRTPTQVPNPSAGQTLKSTHPAFELNTPTNASKTVDIPWAAGASTVIAQINPMEDPAQSWGLGCAVSWNGETYLQVNVRVDGSWNIVQNGVESQIQGCVKGKPANLAIKLSDHHVEILYKYDQSDWVKLTQFPRAEFPGQPATIRVGKIGPKWNPSNFSDLGDTKTCRIEGVQQY